MLRPILPNDPPPSVAYRVPWHVRRDDPRHPVIVNESSESADFVRVFRDDAAEEPTQWWGQVLPAEDIELCLCTADLEEVIVTIAWFRPGDGLEYLWKFTS